MSDILFPLPLGEDQGEGLQRAKSLTPLSPLPAGEGIWSAPASTALYISSAERTLESSPALSALGFSIYLSARPRLHEGGLTTDAAVAKRYFLKDSYLDLQSLNPLFALRCSVPYLPKRELMATIPAQSFRCLLLTLPIIEWSHSHANRKLWSNAGPQPPHVRLSQSA